MPFFVTPQPISYCIILRQLFHHQAAANLYTNNNSLVDLVLKNKACIERARIPIFKIDYPRNKTQEQVMGVGRFGLLEEVDLEN